jgi:hypothetical protein
VAVSNNNLCVRVHVCTNQFETSVARGEHQSDGTSVAIGSHTLSQISNISDVGAVNQKSDF